MFATFDCVGLRSLTSVLVSGQADTSGDQTFPSDSDSYSVNTALVEVEFEVVGSYDVQFSSNAAGTNLDGSFFDNEFGENVFLLTDDNSVITSDSFTGRIGPGNYLIRTSSSASAGTPFFEGQSNTIVVASFTAVPEPSSLAVLSLFLSTCFLR